MCCSFETIKRVVPFAITFALGLLIASAFYSFTSPTKVKSVQANEVKVYKSKSKKSSCKTRAYRNNTYRSRSNRVVRPTLQETIIINEEVKKSN